MTALPPDAINALQDESMSKQFWNDLMSSIGRITTGTIKTSNGTLEYTIYGEPSSYNFQYNAWPLALVYTGTGYPRKNYPYYSNGTYIFEPTTGSKINNPSPPAPDYHRYRFGDDYRQKLLREPFKKRFNPNLIKTKFT